MKSRITISHLLAFGIIALTPTFLAAQGSARARSTARSQGSGKETQAQLTKEAKVKLADAEATALMAVPGGKVSKHVLERANGTLIYAIDVAQAGKPGFEEVHVDATSGMMLEHTHMNAAPRRAAGTSPRRGRSG